MKKIKLNKIILLGERTFCYIIIVINNIALYVYPNVFLIERFTYSSFMMYDIVILLTLFIKNHVIAYYLLIFNAIVNGTLNTLFRIIPGTVVKIIDCSNIV